MACYLGNKKVSPVRILTKPSVLREVNSSNVFGMPSTSVDIILPDKATDIGDYALYYGYYYATGINKFSSNNVTTITGNSALNRAFQYSSITEADMSKVQTVSGTAALQYAFANSDIESLDLSSLVTLSSSAAYMCNNSSSLASVNLENLETISASSAFQYAFYKSIITEMHFKKLKTLTVASVFSYAFGYCENLTLYFEALTTSSFGSNTNQLTSMFGSGKNNTVHFPSNLSSLSWITTSRLAGTNTTILFDLPATE